MMLITSKHLIVAPLCACGHTYEKFIRTIRCLLVIDLIVGRVEAVFEGIGLLMFLGVHVWGVGGCTYVCRNGSFACIPFHDACCSLCFPDTHVRIFMALFHTIVLEKNEMSIHIMEYATHDAV